MRITVNIASFGLLLVFLASCTISPQGRAVSLSGVIAGETRWQRTVFIDGDLVLEKEARLVIAPGTEVVFLLPAEGTAETPTTFHFVEPSALSGSWDGINLRESSLTHFRYVYISQANSAIHSHSAEATMEDSRIEHKLFGLRFYIFGNHRYAVVLGEEDPDDVIMEGNYWEGRQPRKNHGGPVRRAQG